MTHQALSWMALGAILLICLGLLLGAAWTTQILQPKLHRQAEERRKLNEAWEAVLTTRQQRAKCPRCTSVLTERDWVTGGTQTLVEDPSQDD